MKPRAVKRTEPPAYPTRGRLLSEMDLLRTRQPLRWQVGKDVAGAAAILLAANLTGCGGNLAVPGSPPPAMAAAAATDTAAPARDTKAKVAALVAPIFEHGEGRGATGCVVVSPPAFLSEEEAMQVIKEELGKHGIRLKAGVTLEDVSVAPRSRRGEGDPRPQTAKRANRSKPLTLDGMDTKKLVAVEFVSGEQSLELEPADIAVSVSAYETKHVAKYLASEIDHQAKRKIYAGVFYDPLVRFNVTEKDTRPAAAAEAKKLLRLQARDFVAWLKKQKVI